jgi:hypothetical protein
VNRQEWREREALPSIGGSVEATVARVGGFCTRHARGEESVGATRADSLRHRGRMAIGSNAPKTTDMLILLRFLHADDECKQQLA